MIEVKKKRESSHRQGSDFYLIKRGRENREGSNCNRERSSATASKKECSICQEIILLMFEIKWNQYSD
jgi:hypothetical protein